MSKTPPNQPDAQLEALLIEGLATGEDIPLTPEFWSELKQDAAKIFARRKQPGKKFREP